MGRVRIDIGKAIEMRVSGATLRDIGEYFGTSPEAVRQALQRAHKKKREQKKLAGLLVAASTDEHGRAKSPKDIAKIIEDWAAILEAAKKGIALESEITRLKERLSRVELSLSLENNKGAKRQRKHIQSKQTEAK